MQGTSLQLKVPSFRHCESAEALAKAGVAIQDTQRNSY
jgi:hypothetical protein